MKYESFKALRHAILSVLQNYCKNYILFKPTHYFIAKRYIEKIKKSDHGNSMLLLKNVFDIYKLLLKKNSEIFATNIGLILAKELEIDEIQFLKYREARILTQRYSKGFGLFESQIYKKINNNIITEVSIDPIYTAYQRLNNHYKLSQLMIKEVPMIASAMNNH